MVRLTPARVHKAVTIVGACLEAQIALHADQAAECRNLLYALKRVVPPGAGPRPSAAVPTKPTGKRPAAGSLPGRILDILGELDADRVSISQIMAAKPGAKEGAVRFQLSGLVKAGWVHATGATSQRRYSLPAKKGGR